HAHRVIEIRPAHLVFETDGEGFFGKNVHLSSTGDAARNPECRLILSPSFYHADSPPSAGKIPVYRRFSQGGQTCQKH
ncbi:MAG TPA: hypothetical protein PKA11_11835, partial [Accumulibacter sp.]|nr:hypothetical protein [Accumulibacter sp.]